MNRVVIALLLLVLCVGFVGVHTHKIFQLDQEAGEICNRIENAYRQENWNDVEKGLADLEERWQESRFWACLTIETREIEDLEISLRQSKEYARIHAKEQFIGEFSMFRMTLEHLPHQEGFSIEELL